MPDPRSIRSRFGSVKGLRLQRRVLAWAAGSPTILFTIAMASPIELICVTCDASSKDTRWGHYRAACTQSIQTAGDASSLAAGSPGNVPSQPSSPILVPYLTGCFKCVAGVSFGAWPQEPPAWEDIEETVAEDDSVQPQIRGWSEALDETDVKFVPWGVQRSHEMSIKWQETADIKVVDGGGAVSPTAGHTTMMTDLHGKERSVVLTNGSQPQAVLEYKTTTKWEEHHLGPETVVHEDLSKLMPFAMPMIQHLGPVVAGGGGARLATPTKASPAARLFGSGGGRNALTPESLSLRVLSMSPVPTTPTERSLSSAGVPSHSATSPPPLAPPPRLASASAAAEPEGAAGGAMVPCRGGLVAVTSGRRLREHRSDPDPLDAVALGSKVRRVSAGKSKEPRGSIRGSKKEGLPPLTVENVLGRKFEQPRVVLGWRRTSYKLAQERGSLNATELYREDAHLQIIQAAINLMPDEIGTLSDSVLKATLDLLLPYLAPKGMVLPTYIAQALVRRAAKNAGSAALVVRIAWPWTGSPESSRAADAAAAAADDREAGSSLFDAYGPRLRDVVSGSQSESQTAKAADEAHEMLICEFLATCMMGKGSKSKAIVELMEAVLQAPAPPTGTEQEEVAIYQEMLGTISGIAAMVQPGPCTTQQIRALRKMAGSLEDDSGQAHSLDLFLRDPWWCSRREEVWTRAVDEGAAAPQMERISAVLGSESSPAEAVAQAWQTAELKMKKWQQSLRDGATAAVVRVLTSHAKQQVTRLLEEAEGGGRPAKEWVPDATETRRRLDWLRLACGAQLGDFTTQLDIVFNDKASTATAETAVELVRIALRDLEEGTSDNTGVPLELLTEITETLERAGGVATLGKDEVTDVERLLEILGNQAEMDCPTTAAVGQALCSSLPKQGPDDSVDSRVVWLQAEAWETTSLAVSMLGFAERLQTKSDSESDALFVEVAGALKAWKHMVPEGAGHMDKVLGQSTDKVANAAEIVQEWALSRTLKRGEAHLQAVQVATQALADVCQGKAGGGTWKGALTSASTWEDIEREAQYHLVDSDGAGLHAKLDDLFKKMTAAQGKYDETQAELATLRVNGGGARADADIKANVLTEQAKQVTSNAHVTHTESYFFEVLKAPAADRSRLVLRRMEQMAENEISSDDILPALWRKIMLLSSTKSAGSRPAPQTPVQPRVA